MSMWPPFSTGRTHPVASTVALACDRPLPSVPSVPSVPSWLATLTESRGHYHRPANAGWQRDLAMFYDRLFKLDTTAGKLDDARAWFNKSRAVTAIVQDIPPWLGAINYSPGIANKSSCRCWQTPMSITMATPSSSPTSCGPMTTDWTCTATATPSRSTTSVAATSDRRTRPGIVPASPTGEHHHRRALVVVDVRASRWPPSLTPPSPTRTHAMSYPALNPSDATMWVQGSPRRGNVSIGSRTRVAAAGSIRSRLTTGDTFSGDSEE